MANLSFEDDAAPSPVSPENSTAWHKSHTARATIIIDETSLLDQSGRQFECYWTHVMDHAATPT